MSLNVLYQIKYAQVDPVIDNESEAAQWHREQEQEVEKRKLEKQRHRFLPFTPGMHRGVSLSYKPQQSIGGAWEPGQPSHISFPIFQYPELAGDPDIVGSEAQLIHTEAGPPVAEGPEREHYLQMMEQLRQQGQPIAVGEGEMPEGYVVNLPGALDIFTESKKSGQAGAWLSSAYGAAANVAEGQLYSYLHPSLLSSNLDIASFPKEYKHIIDDEKQRRKNKEPGIKNLSIFLDIMGLIHNYINTGKQLANHPEDNDIDVIAGFFRSLKQNTANEETEKLTNPKFLSMSDRFARIYKFMEDRCEIIHAYNNDVRQLARINSRDLGEAETTGSVGEAISFAINNTIRKLLSGYYVVGNNFSENNEQTVKSLINYITGSLTGDLQKYYKSQLLKSSRLETDTIYQSDAGDNSRGLEDTVSDLSQNTEEEAIERIEAQQKLEAAILGEDVSEETETIDPDINIRKKQNDARRLVLDDISKIFNIQLKDPNVLDRWTEEFKQFLINHQTYIPRDLFNILPEIFNVIDFSQGILPKNAAPCPNCGKTFIKTPDGKLEPAFVKLPKGNLSQCRNCTVFNKKTEREEPFTFARSTDVTNSLSIPLLAFLESKKINILKDNSLPLQKRVDIAEEIEKLMSTTFVRVIIRGSARSGKSSPGSEVVLLYKNGKMFLSQSKRSKPDRNILLAFAELNEMPLQEFLAGSGFPIGGAQVGYSGDISDIQTPFSETGKVKMTPALFSERGDILSTTIGIELVPIVAKDPAIQKMFGDLNPVEFATSKSLKNLFDQYITPMMKEILLALNNIKIRMLSSGQKASSYQDMLNITNPTIIQETIYQLSRKYRDIIPGKNSPAPSKELAYILQRGAQVLDTIASMNNVDINNISVQQLLSLGEDPAAKQDPWYLAASDVGQFVQPVETHTGKMRDVLEDYEQQQQQLQANESIIDQIIAFIKDNEQSIINSQLPDGTVIHIPENHTDPIIKPFSEYLSQQLTASGFSVDTQTVAVALSRLGALNKNYKNIYQIFQNNEIPTEDGMVDLSALLAHESSKEIIKSLIQRPSSTSYSAIEPGPGLRLLGYLGHANTAFSISDFIQMLLVSASGMFGVAENYITDPAYFEEESRAGGVQTRFLPETEDLASKWKSGVKWKNLSEQPPAFDYTMREKLSPGHPLHINVTRRQDPYSSELTPEKEPELYKIFADQFSPDAIANNPRYQYYIQQLSQTEEFYGMTPKEIVESLRNDVTRIVSDFYKNEQSELFRDDPVMSMRAIASFFVPSELINTCLDIWAREMSDPTIPTKEKKSGDIQNAFYMASNILFDIYNQINGITKKQPNESDDAFIERQRQEQAMFMTERSDRFIAKEIIAKYKLDRSNWGEKWFDYLIDLLSRISEDIRNNKGCASRALSVIGDQRNLQYLSSKYDPSIRRYHSIAENYPEIKANLKNISSLIRLASINVDKYISDDLKILKTLVDDELYA